MDPITAAMDELITQGWSFDLVPGKGYEVKRPDGSKLEGRHTFDGHWPDVREAIDAAEKG